MKRTVWSGTAAAGVLLLLVACGGGDNNDTAPPPDGSAAPVILEFATEQAIYYVGDRARLTARYENGAGHIEPGDLPIASGGSVTTPALAADSVFYLVVSHSSGSTRRQRLVVPVDYRNRLRPVSTPFRRAEHTATMLDDGRVLIAGGDDAQGNTLPTANYVFDPQTETFTPFGQLQSGRFAHLAVRLADGHVLIAHGVKTLPQAPAAEVLDSMTGVSSGTVNSPARTRTYAAAVRLEDGNVLITGGFTNGADPTAEIYDPASRTFSTLTATMSFGRYGHTATLLIDGQVLLYGGFTTNNLPAAPELYDPETMTFSTLAAPESGQRGGHQAIAQVDGTVWIVGGENENSEMRPAILRYLPQTRSFDQPGELRIPRTDFSAAALLDSELVVLGGLTESGTKVVGETEVLAPQGANRNGPAMTPPRFLHTATPLPNGRVLVFGGLDAANQPAPLAELYE